MTRIWKGLAACVGTLVVATCATCSNSLYSQEATPSDAPPAAAEEAADEDEGIEFDESTPDEESAQPGSPSVGEALEAAAVAELGDAAKSSSPDDLINLATDIKLNANSLLDLTKVISLCNKAEALGLDEDSLEFARQLRISAQLERGLSISQFFLDPDLEIAQLPQGWEGLRDNSINDLETAVKENPEMAVAQLALGRLYMLAGADEQAKIAFDLALGSDDESAEAEVKAMALMYRSLLESSNDEALKFVEKAIEFCPESEPRLYSQYASYLLLCNRAEEALTQINKAIELGPDFPKFKKIKASVLAKLGRNDEALASFDESMKGQENNVLVQVDRARFLAAIERPEDAIESFTKLIEKYNGPLLFFFRGAVYASMEKYEEALKDADQALRRDSELIMALQLKGEVYLKMKNYDESIRMYEQVRAKSKEEAEKISATAQIAYNFSQKGEYQRMCEILKTNLEKFPKNEVLLRTFADSETAFGHWQESAKYYEELVSVVGDKDPVVLNNYAWLLCTCPDDSIRDAKRAMEYALKSAEATNYEEAFILSTLAAAYAENGDFENARKWSQKSIELSEKEEKDNVEHYREEMASYQENKPWRKTSEIIAEVQAAPADAQ